MGASRCGSGPGWDSSANRGALAGSLSENPPGGQTRKNWLLCVTTTAAEAMLVDLAVLNYYPALRGQGWIGDLALAALKAKYRKE